MRHLSRRKLIAAAAAAPIAASAPSDAQTDPIITSVRTWLLEREATDALGREWQRLETKLFREHGGMTTRAAIRRGLPEGREMRALERRLKAADSKLARKAARITRMRAATKEGALAKIEMGLKIQSPLDCEDHAWTLIESGFAELRALL